MLRLALLLLFCSSIAARADEYDDLRAKWSGVLTGGPTLSLADPAVTSRIASIDNAAIAQRDTLNLASGRTYLWSDAASTTVSADLSTNYSRIRTMAIAYATRGSSLEGNATLRDDILGALDWMNANRYNSAKTEYDNWWDWEIGAPQKLNDIMVLIYPSLTSAQLTANLAAIDKFVPASTYTGANRTDTCLVVAIRGIVGKSSAKIANARDALSAVFPYVTSGDGFYTDGSFIQHTAHAYTGSYGAELIKGVAYLYQLLGGSTWQVVDPACDNVFQWISAGYAPLFFRGAMMDMVRGRAVSRSGSGDQGEGAYILGHIMRFARTAPSAQGAPGLSFVKGQATADTYRNFVSNIGIAQLADATALMADSSIPPAGEPPAHILFPLMDRAVHRRAGFAFGLAMSSTRIYNYESINSENLKGWFTGDGMLYFYNSDLGQFADNWWPTVDPYHMPGVTADTATRANSSNQGTYNVGNAWVGGVNLDGIYGSEAMQFTGKTDGLVAKKSWFFFDNEAVCLGSGITATAGTTAIHTTIENRRLGSTGNERFTVNGADQSTTLGWSATLSGTNWCALDGTAGYYFPGGSAVLAKREARTGSWSAINSGQSTTSVTKNYLTLWFNHGVKPSGASYAYVILPNFDATATAAYAAAPDVQILANTTAVQAVREATLGITGAHFWNDASTTAGTITCDHKAAVMLRRTSTNLDIAVSDPTWLNTTSINLIIADTLPGIVSLDAGVTITQLSPQIHLTVSPSAARGKTFHAHFSNFSIANDHADTTPGTPVLIDVLGNDLAAVPPLALNAITTQPAHGTATIAGGAVRYIPNSGFTGTDIFTYSASDSQNSSSATITIDVAAAPPPLSPSAVFASTDDGNVPANTLDGSLATRWSASGNPQWIEYDFGTLRLLDAVSLAFYVGDTRVTTFDVGVSADGITWETILTGAHSSGTTLNLERYALPNRWTRYVRVTGHGNNLNTWNSITETSLLPLADSAPVAPPLTLATTPGTPVVFAPLAAATDADAGPSALRLVYPGASSHGTVEAVDSTVRFTPAAGYAGSTTFTCQISDGNLVTEVPLTVNVVRASANLTWTGNQAGNPNRWDANNTQNWTLGVSPSVFAADDRVNFDDSAASFAPDIPAAVSPGSVVFSNVSHDYTLTGASGIAGTAALTKFNSGTLTIANTNTYTGATTVLGGTLLVNGSLSSAAVVLSPGATLGGTGTIVGTITAPAGSTIAPGASVGTLNTGATTLGGTLAIEIDGAAADMLNVTGNLDLTDATLAVTILPGGFTQPRYVIARYSGTLTGTFAGIPSGYVMKYNQGVAGNQITLEKPSGFAAWVAAYPALAGTDTQPSADPAHDGVPNIMKYVLGGDPTTPAAAILPVATIISDNLVFSYQRSDISETDTTQTVQWSADLVTWHDISVGPASSGPVTVAENGSAPDDIRVAIPLSNAVHGKLYARLKVTAP